MLRSRLFIHLTFINNGKEWLKDLGWKYLNFAFLIWLLNKYYGDYKFIEFHMKN